MIGKLVLTLHVDPFHAPAPVGRILITSSVKPKEFHRSSHQISPKEIDADSGHPEAFDRLLVAGVQKCLELAEDSRFCSGGIMVQTEDLRWRQERKTEKGKKSEIAERAEKLLAQAASQFGVSFHRVEKLGREWVAVTGEWAAKKSPDKS